MCVNWAGEASLDQQRQSARVVDVGVAEHHRVNLCRVEGKVIAVSSLGLSAALDKWPRLAAAYDAGLLSRSQAQVVRHVLEPETEAGWVCLASKTPVRKLKKWVDGYRKVEKGIAPGETLR